MKLQTKVDLPRSEAGYDHQSRFLCLGSCFAAEIGQRLHSKLFDCITNPLGTVFNPIAIAEILDRALLVRAFRQEEFFEHQELWSHFLVHSSLASTHPSDSLALANARLSSIRTRLLDCELLILSLGSAYIYELPERQEVIGHNHKLPLSSFRRRLLDPVEIESRLRSSIESIRAINPKLSILLTVSPVRHLRDGLHENNLSKAALLLAANKLRATCASVDYFPAYEILLDELRDYRFYASDMAHPSSQAVDYIWDCFAKTYLSHAGLGLCKEIEAIDSSLNHRPQRTGTKSYKQFKEELEGKVRSLVSKIPRASQLLDRLETLP